jgi:hypothetical protein
MTNPKHQIPTKFQIPIFKFLTHITFKHAGKVFRYRRLAFGAWLLGFGTPMEKRRREGHKDKQVGETFP